MYILVTLNSSPNSKGYADSTAYITVFETVATSTGTAFQNKKKLKQKGLITSIIEFAILNGVQHRLQSYTHYNATQIVVITVHWLKYNNNMF